MVVLFPAQSQVIHTRCSMYSVVCSFAPFSLILVQTSLAISPRHPSLHAADIPILAGL